VDAAYPAHSARHRATAPVRTKRVRATGENSHLCPLCVLLAFCTCGTYVAGLRSPLLRRCSVTFGLHTPAGARSAPVAGAAHGGGVVTSLPRPPALRAPRAPARFAQRCGLPALHAPFTCLPLCPFSGFLYPTGSQPYNCGRVKPPRFAIINSGLRTAPAHTHALAQPHMPLRLPHHRCIYLHLRYGSLVPTPYPRLCGALRVATYTLFRRSARSQPFRHALRAYAPPRWISFFKPSFMQQDFGRQPATLTGMVPRRTYGRSVNILATRHPDTLRCFATRGERGQGLWRTAVTQRYAGCTLLDFADSRQEN